MPDPACLSHLGACFPGELTGGQCGAPWPGGPWRGGVWAQYVGSIVEVTRLSWMGKLGGLAWVGDRHGGVHGSLGLALGTEEACVHMCFWVRLGGGHRPAWLTPSELSCHSGEWPGELISAGGVWAQAGPGLATWSGLEIHATSDLSLGSHCTPRDLTLQGLAFSPLAEVTLPGRHFTLVWVEPCPSGASRSCQSVGCVGGQHWPGTASAAGSVLCLGSFSWGPNLCI